MLVSGFVYCTQARVLWEEEPQLGKCLHQTDLQASQWDIFLIKIDVGVGGPAHCAPPTVCGDTRSRLSWVGEQEQAILGGYPGLRKLWGTSQ